MLKLRSVTAGALATAMLATSVAPAMAQGYGGGYPGSGYGRPGYDSYGHRDYRRHRKNDDTGAIVAGVIGVGILAAIIASASSKSKRQSQAYNNGYSGNIRTDDAAADGCAVAAEQQLGGSARVNAITAVDRVSDGYNVRGTLDYGRSGSGYGNGYGNTYDQRGFSCSVRYGNVSRVDFGG